MDYTDTSFLQYILGELTNPSYVKRNTNNKKSETITPLWEKIDDNCYRIVINTPGISKEDINITFENGKLHVTGQTKFLDITYMVDTFINTNFTEHDLSQIEKVEYNNRNGLTYIYLYIEIKKAKDIKIQKI